jgi:hypothetical protein
MDWYTEYVLKTILLRLIYEIRKEDLLMMKDAKENPELFRAWLNEMSKEEN